MVSAVFDTNVVVSGFLWRGAPFEIVNAGRRGILRAYSSFLLLDELEKTLTYAKFQTRLKKYSLTPEEIKSIYESFAIMVPLRFISEVIVRSDPSDDAVIQTALSAEAEYIVSGDVHLLSLHEYRFIRIVNPSDFLKIIRSRK